MSLEEITDESVAVDYLIRVYDVSANYTLTSEVNRHLRTMEISPCSPHSSNDLASK